MISRKLSSRWVLIFPVLLFSLTLVAQTTADCGYTKGQSFSMCPDGYGCVTDVCVITSNKVHLCTTYSVACKCSDGSWQSVGKIQEDGIGGPCNIYGCSLIPSPSGWRGLPPDILLQPETIAFSKPPSNPARPLEDDTPSGAQGQPPAAHGVHQHSP
jgi:hypothetical protein